MPKSTITEFIPDPLLAEDPDCPVFGFNLACAFPFPPETAAAYRPPAERLAKLHPGLYVYPDWETHVTIVTFVNFSKHRRPTPEQRAALESLMPGVIELVRTAPLPAPFQLILDRPVLTPKAVILPIHDSAGAIPHLRAHIRTTVENDPAWRAQLENAGWNIPGIIHSTIARFTAAPIDPMHFRENFDRIAASTEPIPLTVRELLITTETKPYMREGEIIHRFPLAEKF